MITILQEGTTYMKVIFIDESQVLYFSEIQKTRFSIELSQVYKLRSITISSQKDIAVIKFFEYSDALRIPNEFVTASDLKSNTSNAKYPIAELKHLKTQEIKAGKFEEH